MACVPNVLDPGTLKFDFCDGSWFTARKGKPIDYWNSRFCEQRFGMTHFYEIRYYERFYAEAQCFSFPFIAFTAPSAEISAKIITALRKERIC